jgi:hypothetical protein
MLTDPAAIAQAVQAVRSEEEAAFAEAASSDNPKRRRTW